MAREIAASLCNVFLPLMASSWGRCCTSRWCSPGRALGSHQYFTSWRTANGLDVLRSSTALVCIQPHRNVNPTTVGRREVTGSVWNTLDEWSIFSHVYPFRLRSNLAFGELSDKLAYLADLNRRWCSQRFWDGGLRARLMVNCAENQVGVKRRNVALMRSIISEFGFSLVCSWLSKAYKTNGGSMYCSSCILSKIYKGNRWNG